MRLATNASHYLASLIQFIFSAPLTSDVCLLHQAIQAWIRHGSAFVFMSVVKFHGIHRVPNDDWLLVDFCINLVLFVYYEFTKILNVKNCSASFIAVPVCFLV